MGPTAKIPGKKCDVAVAMRSNYDHDYDHDEVGPRGGGGLDYNYPFGNSEFDDYDRGYSSNRGWDEPPRIAKRGIGRQRQYSFGGWIDESEDFRRGRGINSRNNAGGRIQDYYTPGEREMWQQEQNQGVRYGWQQHYNVGRGNVRRGSSSNFRRGNAFDRVQDYYTPGERELRQQQDNRGARYGWQQQYDTSRGNVRGGSSSNFRRGRAFDRMQDFLTPLERERRAMQENRDLGRGQTYPYYGRKGDMYGGWDDRDFQWDEWN